MKAENRKLFHEQEVEKCLVTLLGSENDGTKIAASQAISAMCENLGSKEFFNNQGKQTGKKKKKKKSTLNICTLPCSSSHGHLFYPLLPFFSCRDPTVNSVAKK